MARQRLFLLAGLAVLISLSSPSLVLGQEEGEAAPEETTTESSTSEQTTTTEESTTNAESATTTDSTEKETKKKEEPKKVDDDFDVGNEDWGSYYDPQNIFCGKYDCYQILGFDYENYGQQKPDRKTITKRYRALSREWHPDKSKHRNAKNRFVKIARAYEVLTDEEVRKEYDMMRYDQEAYFQKYGTSVLWNYAPKSDVSMVLLIIFVVANIFSWTSQRHRWKLVADRLAKAAVEDWNPSQGGTPESKQLREEALAILADQQKENDTSTDSKAASTNSKKKGGKKVSGKERKRQEQEALQPIVTALVGEMHDFGSGFHKPTWRDLFVVSLAKLPYKLTVGTIWQTKYWIRRLRGKELNDEERQVLTERAVGPVSWNSATEEERQDMIARELWDMDNLVEWKEEQEVKQLSAADQKYYAKLKKKGKLE